MSMDTFSLLDDEQQCGMRTDLSLHEMYKTRLLRVDQRPRTRQDPLQRSIHRLLRLCRYLRMSKTRRSSPMPDEILDMTRAYTARERKQSRWRALHCYASLVVWAACLVAVWFSPRNLVAFLLMLLASLTLATGLVDGLLALLFFSSEIRSLHEFEWEVRNARRAALAATAPAVDNLPNNLTLVPSGPGAK
ncbi:hypothetical protein OCS_02490 [Ophiocordyceps sinensis CO18]|uniref:Uncharacterized protein n=1 Tax=Ophiocordyceps sinensis (strain Co18 / CGMCC 3.14243) TaxID=911162 RepID=T5A8I8_OPHSC|nr:hypothetical protein OCS_02490 [Ophiocordyceps sinensis CO18]